MCKYNVKYLQRPTRVSKPNQSTGKLWEHEFESRGQPKPPVSVGLQRTHQAPRKDSGCRILKQWCLPCSWGGLCSTLCCSEHSSHEVHPHSRIGYTCHIAGIKCAGELSSSQELAQGWNIRVMLSFWLCCRHVRLYLEGRADHPWDTNQL